MTKLLASESIFFFHFVSIFIRDYVEYAANEWMVFL